MLLPPPSQLDGRRLWADGISEVAPADLKSFIYKVGTGALAVTELTPEVEALNELLDRPILPKQQDSALFPPQFTLPDKYKYLDIAAYCLSLASKVKQDHLYEERLERLSTEIYLFMSLGLEDVLRALIYAVETMAAKGVVWGVGRGSSCSSYLLHLIGLHEVDPVLYGIEITDFIKPKG